MNTEKLWTLELGAQEGNKVPIWNSVGFQQTDRQDSQNLSKDMFYKPPITSAQCIIGTKKSPDFAILITFDDDYYSQGSGQIEEAFRALTKDDILEPYITDNDLQSPNNNNDIG